MRSQCLNMSARVIVVKNDFENSANNVAFNHDDEWSIVLVSDVAQ